MLKVVVTDDVALKYQNKIVCDITEYRLCASIYGNIASWKGSTENEYFCIVFSAGCITISMSEREYCSNLHPIKYANSIKLLEMMTSEELFKKYITDIYPIEYKEISIDHILKLFNWKLNERSKVYIDMAFN